MPQYPPPQYQGRPKFWTKGKAAAVLVLVVVLGIAIAGVAMNMPFLQEGSSFIIGYQVQLYKSGDNNTIVVGSNAIMFPKMALVLQGNSTCANIFSSIKSQVTEVRLKMTAPANDKTWTPTGGTLNTLTTIDPYTTYYVTVSADCSLQLKSLLPT